MKAIKQIALFFKDISSVSYQWKSVLFDWGTHCFITFPPVEHMVKNMMQIVRSKTHGSLLQHKSSVYYIKCTAGTTVCSHFSSHTSTSCLFSWCYNIPKRKELLSWIWNWKCGMETSLLSVFLWQINYFGETS